jgi:hypothetical protein
MCLRRYVILDLRDFKPAVLYLVCSGLVWDCYYLCNHVVVV